MRTLVVAAFALVLGGCVTTGSADPPTPSGRPEVTVKAAPNTVKGFIENQMVNAGYTVQSDSGSRLAFGKHGEPTMGIPAEWGYRIDFTLLDLPPNTRVIAEPRAVLHYGTPFEAPYNLSAQYGERANAQASAVLSSLQHKFGG